MQPDKLPPFDGQAESTVLGALLVDPSSVWSVIATGLTPSDFFREQNSFVYEAITELAKAGPADGINQVTVARKLARRERLEAIGGIAYLSKLMAELPTAVGVEYSAVIIRELAQHRQLISVGTRIVQEAYRAQDKPQAAMARAVDSIMAVSGRSYNGHRTLKDMFSELLDGGQVAQAGVELGLPSLARAVPFLGAGDMMIVAASTSVGKTAFALNIARNVGLYQRKPVAIFSVEMGSDALFRRLLSLEAGIPSDQFAAGIRHGRLNDWHQRLINEAGGRLCDAPIELLDSTGWTVQHVGLEARRIQAQKGLALLVIDYLQLLSSGARADNQTHEVSLVSRATKEIAHTLAVPVLAISQLNRNAGDDKPPELRHLLQSGSLERDADIVLFLHWVDRKKTEERQVQAIIAKNRNGSLTSKPLIFRASTGYFEDPEGGAGG